MMLEGTITKEGKLWVVDVPLLGGPITQGRSRSEALQMARDWLDNELEVSKASAGIVYDRSETFYLIASDSAKLIALVLKRLRLAAGLTVREASARMGSKSPNAYGLYERGKATPSPEKLSELLRVVDPGYQHDLVLRRA